METSIITILDGWLVCAFDLVPLTHATHHTATSPTHARV